MWCSCTKAHLWRCPIGPSDFNGPETPFITRLDEKLNFLSFLEAPEALSFDSALQEIRDSGRAVNPVPGPLAGETDTAGQAQAPGWCLNEAGHCKSEQVGDQQLVKLG